MMRCESVISLCRVQLKGGNANLSLPTSELRFIAVAVVLCASKKCSKARDGQDISVFPSHFCTESYDQEKISKQLRA